MITYEEKQTAQHHTMEYRQRNRKIKILQKIGTYNTFEYTAHSTKKKEIGILMSILSIYDILMR